MTPESQQPASSPSAAPETPQPKRVRKRGISKGGLAKAAEQWMLKNAPEVLAKLAKAIGEGVDKREKTSMEMASRLFLGDRGPDGTNILHQNLTINSSGDQAAGARSLESIIRKLEVKDSFRALPAATPIRQGADDILDAEEV